MNGYLSDGLYPENVRVLSGESVLSVGTSRLFNEEMALGFCKVAF